MSEPELPPDELDDLIAAYADGQLDTEQARRLLELIEGSPDARARLAAAVAVERTLRAMAQGPVASDRIMAAIKASRAAAHVAPSPRPARGRTRSPLIAVGVVVVVMIAGLFFLRPGNGPLLRTKETAHVSDEAPGANAEATSPPEQAPALVVEPETTGARPEPPALEQLVEVAEPQSQTPLPGVEYRPVYPWEVPASPSDLAPAPPGDGSQEAGYVPPPAARAVEPSPAEPATVPTLWTRVTVGDAAPWSVTAGDVQRLMKEMLMRIGVRYRATEADLDQLDFDPARNPILLFTTHHRFRFTAAQRARLRRYVLRGGTVLFDAGLGSAPAYDAARREVRAIFADLPLKRLFPDHPIFHAGYEVARAAGLPDGQPWLEAVSIDCRAAVLISRWGLAAGWAGRSAGIATAYGEEDALRLGINLSSYAASARAWARREGGLAAFPIDDAPAAGRMSVAQVIHGDDWRTRPAAFALLLHAFNRQTDVPVKLRVRELRLDDPEVTDAPLLYLTGHEAPALSEAEMAALRRHLENGGFLLAEACCGRRAFDAGFRSVMARVLPGRSLEQVPPDHELFRTPHRIERLAVTSSLAARGGSVLVAPRLEGIRVGAHYAVLYSPLGLAGGWESMPLPYAASYDDPGVLRLGQNILQYAITH